MTAKNANIWKSWGRLSVAHKTKSISANSSQREDEKESSYVKVLEPAYPFGDLIEIYEIDTTAKRCIDIIALNVVAWWFNIVADEWDNSKEIDKQSTEVYNFFMNSNPDEPLTKVLNDLIVDLKSTGNAALEVSRWLAGKPENFYRIPIYTMRYEKSEQWKWFRNGQRFVMNPYSSKWDQVYFNRYYAKEDQRNEKNGYSVDINGTNAKTNEVIWLKLSNPKDRYYGLSPSVTLLKSYLIKKYVDEYNVNEFEWGLLSKFAVLVKNGSLTTESVDWLTAYIQDMIDTKKWSSVPILNVKWQGADIRIEKLWWELKDGSFFELKKESRQDVCTAFWVPPSMLWLVEDVNRSNGIEQEKAFYEKEILPLQQQLEYIFTQMIKYDFGYETLNFKFTAPNFDDRKVVSEITDSGIKNGKYSINEARQMEWLDSIDDEWANERFIHHNSLWLINVKDLWTLNAEAMANAQGNATGKTIVDNLLGIREKYVANMKRKEIANGTDDPDFDEYPDVKE